MVKLLSIPIKDILVNLSNPRYEQQADEESEMIKILTDKNRTYTLMNDIANNGLDPSELPIVVFDTSLSKYVVMEGNRRITSIKVLNDPKLVPTSIPDRSQVIKKVNNIIKEYNYTPINKIQCVVYQEDDPRLNHFIELKHIGQKKGAGRVKWDSESKARFDSTGTFRRSLLTFLKSVHPKIEDNFGLTTIERIVSDPDMRAAIGLMIDKKKAEIRLVDYFSKLKLIYILNGLLTKEFNVNTFYHKPDRQFFANKYLLSETFQPWRNVEGLIKTEESDSGLANEEVGTKPTMPIKNDFKPAIEEASPGSTSPENDNIEPALEEAGPGLAVLENGNPGEVPESGPTKSGLLVGRPPKDITNYDYLLKAVPFKNYYRKNSRINQTLKELAKIEYKEYPIASMYLIRSLLESYVNEYIDFFASLEREHLLKMKNINPKREKRNKKLRELIYDDIYNHLKHVINDYSETYELIHVVFTDNNTTSIMQIINFHVHSNTHYPDKIEILEAWQKVSTVITTLDKLLHENAGQ